MLNFYPWGLSLNLVQPLALDQVEMEDEAVVMTVQRGLRSRLYQRGRYSPGKEQGVHHFHRLIGQVLG